MTYKQTTHELIAQLKSIQEKLGRTPTANEFLDSFVGSRRALWDHFENYDAFIKAAGIQVIDPVGSDPRLEDKLRKQFRKICSTKTQIHGFFVEELDLNDLFRRAGNPQVIKMTGQPDTHLKFVDVPAYKCFKKFLKYYQPDVDLIFGDYLDCEGISHWPPDDMEPRRLVPEIMMGRKDLKERNDLTPKASSRVFLTGNHEDWIRQGFNRMPEFFDGIGELGYDFTLKGLLDLDKLGYNLYEVNLIVKIGKAHFTHGIYCPKAHAAKHLAVFKDNIYYRHTHDYQVVNDTSMRGNIEAASMGCLARLDAKFLKGKPNNWNHGFGIWEFFRDGNFTRTFIPIFNGRCAYNGLVFDGNIP